VTERWVGETLDSRRARAAARVSAWRGSGRHAPVLRLSMPSGPGAEVLAARLADDLRGIGITVQRVGLSSDAELRLVDTVARYPRPDWFLNQLSCANARGLCDSTADVLARRAAGAALPAERQELLAQTEARLTKTNSYIPLGAPVRWSLVSGNVTGFAPNRWNLHPLLPLAMRPK
jgi:ABC-type transport system substrate-binding protein